MTEAEDLNLDGEKLPVDKAAVLSELAKLDKFDLGTALKAKAKELGMSVGDLRAAVGEFRSRAKEQEAVELVEDISPWEGKVSGIELVGEIAQALHRHAVLGPHLPETIALWVMASYLINDFRIFPRLNITAPEKNCGKSTVLDIVKGYVLKPLEAENATVAAIFRTIELCQPTLLIDEADSFLRDNEDARGILNSGHKRGGAVLRVVGDDHTPKQFNTYSPVVIAGIGALPGTLTSRSIVIQVERMSGSERIVPMCDVFDDGAYSVRRKLATWAANNSDAVPPYVEPPQLDNRRTMDNWRPLFTAADLIGGEWPANCRTAFDAFIVSDDEDESIGVLLLGHIKDIFRWKKVDRLYSAELVELLLAVEDGPWPEHRKGKGLNASGLAKLLKPYKVRSQTVRDGVDTAKGYYLKSLKPVFERYCPEPPDSCRHTSQPTNGGASSGFRAVTPHVNVTACEMLQPTDDGACDAVTAKSPPYGEVLEKNEESF